MKTKPLRVTQNILGALKRALRAAKRERCAVEPEHQEAMRLYLDSWVVTPLQAAIKGIEGKESGETNFDWHLNEEHLRIIAKGQ